MPDAGIHALLRPNSYRSLRACTKVERPWGSQNAFCSMFLSCQPLVAIEPSAAGPTPWPATRPPRTLNQPCGLLLIIIKCISGWLLVSLFSHPTNQDSIALSKNYNRWKNYILLWKKSSWHLFHYNDTASVYVGHDGDNARPADFRFPYVADLARLRARLRKQITWPTNLGVNTVAATRTYL